MAINRVAHPKPRQELFYSSLVPLAEQLFFAPVSLLRMSRASSRDESINFSESPCIEDLPPQPCIEALSILCDLMCEKKILSHYWITGSHIDYRLKKTKLIQYSSRLFSKQAIDVLTAIAQCASRDSTNLVETSLLLLDLTDDSLPASEGGAA
jgi:hypothetical protein